MSAAPAKPRGEPVEEDSFRDVTEEMLQAILQAMKKNKIASIGAREEEDGKTRFSLRCSNANDKHAEALSLTFLPNESLEELDMSQTCITRAGFSYIIRGVGFFSKSVTRLAFRRCELGPDAMACLFEEANPSALKNLGNVKELDLSYNCINDATAEQLANALSTNKTLVTLDLRENHITAKGQKALATALARHPTLQSLHTDTSFKPLSRRVCGGVLQGPLEKCVVS